MRGIIGGTCAGLLVAAFCFIGRWGRLDALSGPLHATALPVFTGIAVLVAAGCAAFAALWLQGRHPGAWVFSGLSTVTAVVLIGSQLVTGPGRTATADDGAQEAGSHRLRVVQANLLIDNTNYEAVIHRAEHAHVVALAEADPSRVASELKARDLADDFVVVRSEPAVPLRRATATTVLLVRTSLRPRAIAAKQVPYAAAGVNSAAGRIVAVHTAAPSARTMWQSTWRSTVREAAGLCGAGGGTIVAGDFNAVWPQLRQHTNCADAATTLHRSAAGSWRTGWPAWLGSRIDHQLYSAEDLTPVSFELFDIAGSDHRGTDITYARQGA